MKKDKLNEFKNKSEIELRKDLAEHRERLLVLKFDLAGGKVKNVKDIRSEKKNIAQILTLLKNKKFL